MSTTEFVRSVARFDRDVGERVGRRALLQDAAAASASGSSVCSSGRFDFLRTRASKHLDVRLQPDRNAVRGDILARRLVHEGAAAGREHLRARRSAAARSPCARRRGNRPRRTARRSRESSAARRPRSPRRRRRTAARASRRAACRPRSCRRPSCRRARPSGRRARPRPASRRPADHGLMNLSPRAYSIRAPSLTGNRRRMRQCEIRRSRPFVASRPSCAPRSVLATMSATRQSRDRRASRSPTGPQGLGGSGFRRRLGKRRGQRFEEPNIDCSQPRAPHPRSSSHRHRRAVPERKNQPARGDPGARRRPGAAGLGARRHERRRFELRRRAATR